MNLTPSLLTALGIPAVEANRYLPALNDTLPRHDIDRGLRIAHFLAQVTHESDRMRRVEENMNYSAEGLRKTFGRYFPDDALAAAYARQPARIGARVYANRMGNGNEASGDGWRYRGRGLIQLTGKNNYRAFAQWIGDDDVVAEPERVAERYAVASAVYYWERERLNTLADLDDLITITKRINGGLNGLADRRQLLVKAKAGVQSLPPAAIGSGTRDATGRLDAPTHRVVPLRLNLRDAPRATPSTWIASLPQFTPVAVLGPSAEPGWVRVRVVLRGALREGVVAERYLEPLPTTARAAADADLITAIPTRPPLSPAHLREGRAEITRRNANGRAFPLGEPDRPARTGSDPAQVLAIIDYLDSANPAHLRYRPGRGSTFCNIYAYDVCYLAGVYLPRVWWNSDALQRLNDGSQVDVVYDRTVRELNANALHDWFERYGAAFGWQPEVSLTLLQEAANVGEVGIIVGKRKDLNRSGHIVAVAPEHGGFQARRTAAGDVTRPVESQAGTRNFRYAVNQRAWWLGTEFQSFSLWRHV